MRTVVLILLVVFVLTGTALGGPFLVCDPQPKWNGAGSGVQYYVVTLDGLDPQRSEPEPLGNNTVRLHFDLAGVAVGSHHVEIAAGNVWGESASVPFDFTRELPASPTNIGLEP